MPRCKSFVLNPASPDSNSLNEVLPEKAENNNTIRWSHVVNLFVYLSEPSLFIILLILSLGINDISCPKTELPKEILFLSIIWYFLKREF